MLDIYTVSFFGHREVEHFLYVEKQIERIIKELLATKEYVEFLIGRNGEFDQMVSSAIRRVKGKYRNDNSCHTLVLPYETAEYRNNRQSFENYYDNIDIFENSDNTHYKAVFQKRNREMIDRSDLTVFYLERRFGGAYQTFEYARKQKKEMILISNEDNDFTEKCTTKN
ncbi:MAG: hypothetical protein E7660_03635 [Ruminococcaceae bacterium]|nr:hypothetical protein [Oscillospiraceae bacterium]